MLKNSILPSILISLFTILLFTSPVFADEGDESTVLLPGEDVVREYFQAQMDEDLDTWLALIHPDSEIYPDDVEIEGILETYELFNMSLMVLDVTVAEFDPLEDANVEMVLEIEYLGVVYEEDEAPPFNVDEDEHLSLKLALRQVDDEWLIWDRIEE